MNLFDVTFLQKGDPNGVLSDLKLWCWEEDIGQVHKASMSLPIHLSNQAMVGCLERHNVQYLD